MATKSRGLGRGLDALLGDVQAEMTPAAQENLPSDAVLTLKLTEIDPNRDQPRRRFNETALSELADSIRAVGVLQPIIVRKNGARYVIIAGERRWRASRMAGMTEIPAIVRDWDEAMRLEAALVENLQRDDLNPVEEAAGVSRLMQQCGLTQEAVAARLGRSRPAIANLLRLLTLPDAVKELLISGELSAGHARSLVPLEEKDQLELGRMAAQQGWSVRQLERICQKRLEGEAEEEDKPTPPIDPEFKRLERMARDAFGVPAQLLGDGRKGKLVVPYSSEEDLQRIWDMLEFLQQNEM